MHNIYFGLVVVRVEIPTEAEMEERLEERWFDRMEMEMEVVEAEVVGREVEDEAREMNRVRG